MSTSTLFAKIGFVVAGVGLVGILVANSRSSVSTANKIKIPEPPVTVAPKVQSPGNGFQSRQPEQAPITTASAPVEEAPSTYVEAPQQSITAVIPARAPENTSATSINVPQQTSVVTVQKINRQSTTSLDPTESLDWLNHLQRIEEMRRNLSVTQLGEVITLFTKAITESQLRALSESDEPESSSRDRNNGINALAEKIKSLKQSWAELQRSYLSKKAPENCLRIDRSYSVVLIETGKMQLQILEQLANGINNPENAIATLVKMQGTSESRIDKFAIQAYEELKKVCDSIEKQKWFSISGDFGGSLGFMAKGWSP